MIIMIIIIMIIMILIMFFISECRVTAEFATLQNEFQFMFNAIRLNLKLFVIYL